MPSQRRDYQIVKTESDTYRARVTITHSDGSFTRPSKTFKKRADAITWATEMRSASLRGTVSPRVTVATVARDFLQFKELELQPKTYSDYQRALAKLVDFFDERRPIAEINTNELDRFFDRLRVSDAGKDVSQRTIGYYKQIIKSFFKHAFKRDFVVKMPVIEPKLGKPSPITAEDVLSRNQAKSLLQSAKAHDVYPLLLLLLTTGLRIGEALALTWEDISREGVVTVSKTLQNYDRTEATVKPSPKSHHGARQVKLTTELAHLIRELRGSTSTDRVFPMTYQRYRLAIDKIAEEAGIKKVRPHLLRHTACTLMLSAGLPIKTVVTTMGHKDAFFTLNTYAKFLNEDINAVPKAWESLLSGEDPMPKAHLS